MSINVQNTSKHFGSFHALDNIELDIEGMSCGHCVAAVDKALRKVQGVKSLAVKVGHAHVEAEDTTSRDAVVAAVEGEGYQVRNR